jgi:N utilization substance protein B
VSGLSDNALENERRQLAAARRKARHYAVQALYQWAMTGNYLADIEQHFTEEFDFRGADTEYFRELLHGVPADLSAIEAAMEPYLDIALEKLGPVERAVLRLAVWELKSPSRRALSRGAQRSRRAGEEIRRRREPPLRQRCARQGRARPASRGSRPRALRGSIRGAVRIRADRALLRF